MHTVMVFFSSSASLIEAAPVRGAPCAAANRGDPVCGRMRRVSLFLGPWNWPEPDPVQGNANSGGRGSINRYRRTDNAGCGDSNRRRSLVDKGTRGEEKLSAICVGLMRGKCNCAKVSEGACRVDHECGAAV